MGYTEDSIVESFLLEKARLVVQTPLVALYGKSILRRGFSVESASEGGALGPGRL